LRLAYLLLGTFFLISVILGITATGSFFKEYKRQGEQLGKDTNCVDTLSNVDAKYLEDHGCPAKYEYNAKTKCPSDPAGACFDDV